MLQALTQIINGFFLNPLGLAALLGLIPLLIFYLMRPSPEEKVMPSMQFFQEEEKSGRLRNAFKILEKNLMLLMHILMVIGLALAIANPYIMGQERPEETVILIDNSASMKPVFNQLKTDAIAELGQTNTIIVSNDESEVEKVRASTSSARRFLKNLKLEETGSSIAQGIGRARSYEGEMVVLSDLDRGSSSDKEVDSLLEEISTSRPLKVISPTKSNDWGIVDVDLQGKNATAYIQNFRDEDVAVEFSVAGSSRSLQLEPKELREVKILLQEGRNTLRLEDDGFKVDNKVSLVKPPSRDVDVTVIGEERNRYLMKALQLIEGVQGTYSDSPGDLNSADIFMIDKVSSGQQAKVSEVLEKVKEGKDVVYFAQQDFQQSDAADWPVKQIGERYNTSVSISDPLSLSLSNTTIFRSEVEGRSGSSPEHALKFSSYGDGEFVYMNFASPEFRQSLKYPVFWKNLIFKLQDRPTISDLNLKSGRTVLNQNKSIELTKTGFQTIDDRTYGVNLLNGEESKFEQIDADYRSEQEVGKPSSIRELPIVFLILLGLSELIYLHKRGEIP